MSSRKNLRAHEREVETRAAQILVVGPFPGTSGGIGTMMGHLDETLSSRSQLAFVDPGSTGHRRGWRFLCALISILTHRKSFDLAHINLSSNGSFYRKVLLAMALLAVGKPYIIHLHGSEFRQFYDKSPKLVQLSCRLMMRKASSVLVLGREWKKFVVESLTCQPGHVHILPNAVPGPDSVPNREGFGGNILFTGRVGRRKGVPELLEAVRQMPADVDWTLTLAGDVTDDEVRKMVVESPERVISTGWLSQSRLRDVLQQNSIFVLPSHAEGLPLSLLDAMAWGLAPVVTDVGSVTDVITDGKDGILVKVGDAESIRAALLELISDPARASELGNAARLRWEDGYSMKAYRDRLDDVYDDILKGLKLS
ncbi:glycosyltransferase family 4 protein [Paenarthrobacter nicotinovorans]|uniref:glycosyltransferase family 4 protein n=1 Tax=Paenarthrobacter nicotinovorans TaxID=29320 RepID=UPI003800C2AD